MLLPRHVYFFESDVYKPIDFTYNTRQNYKYIQWQWRSLMGNI